jgi:hypothetical protein
VRVGDKPVRGGGGMPARVRVDLGHAVRDDRVVIGQEDSKGHARHDLTSEWLVGRTGMGAAWEPRYRRPAPPVHPPKNKSGLRGRARSASCLSWETGRRSGVILTTAARLAGPASRDLCRVASIVRTGLSGTIRQSARSVYYFCRVVARPNEASHAATRRRRDRFGWAGGAAATLPNPADARRASPRLNECCAVKLARWNVEFGGLNDEGERTC